MNEPTVARALQFGYGLRRRSDGRWAVERHGRFVLARPTQLLALAVLRVHVEILAQDIRTIGFA